MDEKINTTEMLVMKQDSEQRKAHTESDSMVMLAGGK